MQNTSQIKFQCGDGIFLRKDNGEEYLDAVSGTFNLSLGYNHPYISENLKKQIDQVIHMSSTFTGPYGDECLNEILTHAPENINSGWMRDITGSTANECAIRIAQKFTSKSDIISLYLSHHGQTMFTSSISGNSFRRKSFPNSANSHNIRTPAPYCFRCPFKSTYPKCGFLCIEAIDDAIKYSSNDSIAGLIIEPILGNGGNIIPPKGYFERLRKLCDEHNIILIADEVQTGVGRTGYMFASEIFDIKPNIITLAKGLGGIGIPVASVLLESKLNILEKHEHSFTSGGNMLALVAAKSTIEVVSSPGFLEEVRYNGQLLGNLLSDLRIKHKTIGDVRGIGLMWGLEIVDDDGNPDVEKTNHIIEHAYFKENLILRGSRYGFGNVIKVRPALITKPEEIIEIVKRLSNVFDDIK